MTEPQQNPLIPRPTGDLMPRQHMSLLRRGIGMADQLALQLQTLAQAEDSSPILKLRGTFFCERADELPAEFGIPNKAIPVDEHHVLIASDSCIGLCEWRTGTLKWRIYCSNKCISLSRKHTYLFVQHWGNGPESSFDCWDLRDGSVRPGLAGVQVLDSSPDETRILVRTILGSALAYDPKGRFDAYANHIRLLNVTENPAKVEREGTEWGTSILCKWKARLHSDEQLRRVWHDSPNQNTESDIQYVSDIFDDYLVDTYGHIDSRFQVTLVDTYGHVDSRPPVTLEYPAGYYADSISFDWSNLTAECRKHVGEYFEQDQACFSPDGKYIAVVGNKTDEQSLAALVSLRYDPAFIVRYAESLRWEGDVDCFAQIPVITSKQLCLALLRSSDLTVVSEVNLRSNVHYLSFSQDSRSILCHHSDRATIWSIDPQGSLSLLHETSQFGFWHEHSLCYASDTKTLICVHKNFRELNGKSYQYQYHLAEFDLITDEPKHEHELSLPSSNGYFSQPRIGLIACDNRVLFTDISDTSVMLRDFLSGNILCNVSIDELH